MGFILEFMFFLLQPSILVEFSSLSPHVGLCGTFLGLFVFFYHTLPDSNGGGGGVGSVFISVVRVLLVNANVCDVDVDRRTYAICFFFFFFNSRFYWQ